ncbi:MAG: hypothetical protein EXR69_13715 [Myxococcales bacterium]|nr:hypothetical protein [Myxococcales bacterium]
MFDPVAQVAALFGPYAGQVRPLLPGATLVLGVAALGWGASVWRWVRIASGLVIGVGTGAMLGSTLHDARVGAIAALVLAVGLAIIFYLVERVAVAILGGGVALAFAGVVWPLLNGGQEATPLVTGVAALLASALSGFVHQPVIKVVTAMFGAFLIAGSVGLEGNTLGVLGLGAAGWAWQMWGSGGGSKGGGGGNGAKGGGRTRKKGGGEGNDG